MSNPASAASRWWRIGGSLFIGLFVAYLDRTAVEFGWTLPAGGGVSR